MPQYQSALEKDAGTGEQTNPENFLRRLRLGHIRRNA